MSDKPALRVLSVAHPAVERATGRLRYEAMAHMRDLDVHIVVPARWREYGRTLIADRGTAPGYTLHIEKALCTELPFVKWYGHFYPRLGRLVRQLRPDVIHLWEEPWSIVALQATHLRRGAAIVLEVDQNILRRLPPPFEGIRRHVLSRTDLILSRSPDATAVVRACGFKGPAKPIGYGIDTEIFRPATDVAPSLPDDVIRIGYCGRLTEEKGIDDLLVATTLTKAPVHLSIMGEGPEADALRSRIAELGLERRVELSGWRSPKEVAKFFHTQHLSVLLSRSRPTWREQFGRTIIESQSCGVPVIGTTSGAIPEVIGSGGWTIPERDPLALAGLLDRLHANREEIREKRKAGIENVRSRFTNQMTAERLAAAWKDAAEARRPTKTRIPSGLAVRML